jgi:SAM-dependent methyltransferase
MSINFKEYSKYYDLLYQDKDYQAEVNYVDLLIQKFSGKKSNILELGSGTGKHADLFARKGYSVTGIERSPEMVRISEKFSSERVKFLVGDIAAYKLDEKFDVVVSLFHVISYLNSNEDLVSTFRNVAASLQEDGVFIFDVWYTPAVYSQVPETRIKRLSGAELNVIRIAESEINYRSGVVNVKYEIILENRQDHQLSIVKENHPMRHFTESEIAMLAQLTGFLVLHAEEFRTGNIPGENTWGVCFILKKIS